MGELHDIAQGFTLTDCYRRLDPKEQAKIQAALRGQKPPTPSSRYAQLVCRLALLDPPSGTPPPVPALAVDPLWARDGVFTRSLSSFHGELRDAAKAAGFSCLYVQLDHSDYADSNRQELAVIGDALRAQGWRIAGWATYGQGTDAKQDGIRQAGIRQELSRWLSGWIANGESWAEDANYGKTAEWIGGWTAGGGIGPLAVSCLSSDNPNFARHFDYPTWMAVPGAAIMPQVYGASFPAYTVFNGVTTMQNGGVNRNRLNLTFDVIQGAGPFVDYRTWAGPRSVWTGDDSQVSTWAALAR